MADGIRAILLKGSHSGCVFLLEHELRAQRVEVFPARDCADLCALLTSPNPPELVLADLKFSDGTWEDCLRISQSASLPVNVIVASRLADVRLYMEVLQKGAFDFITPPFQAAEISHVLRTGFSNVEQKRLAHPLQPFQLREPKAPSAFARAS